MPLDPPTIRAFIPASGAAGILVSGVIGEIALRGGHYRQGPAVGPETAGHLAGPPPPASLWPVDNFLLQMRVTRIINSGGVQGAALPSRCTRKAGAAARGGGAAGLRKGSSTGLMSTTSQQASTARAQSVKNEPARLHSRDLLAGAREVVIEHEGDLYRLRCTSKGKLILTK